MQVSKLSKVCQRLKTFENFCKKEKGGLMEIGKEVTASLTLEFAQKARERKERGDRIISLGIGQPDFKVPQDIVEATVDALRGGFDKYSDPQGILSLRKAIAEKLETENIFHYF